MEPPKKRCNGAGWNKDQSQGVKSHFTQAEIKYLVQTFMYEENWHDLTLFLEALDTALRASDLLDIKVGDVCYSNGRQRWSRNFGPTFRVDRMTKVTIQNEEKKEPFA